MLPADNVAARFAFKGVAGAAAFAIQEFLFAFFVAAFWGIAIVARVFADDPGARSFPVLARPARCTTACLAPAFTLFSVTFQIGSFGAVRLV